jgi:hypothetical protein
LQLLSTHPSRMISSHLIMSNHLSSLMYSACNGQRCTHLWIHLLPATLKNVAIWYLFAKLQPPKIKARKRQPSNQKRQIPAKYKQRIERTRYILHEHRHISPSSRTLPAMSPMFRKPTSSLHPSEPHPQSQPRSSYPTLPCPRG